jgi:hypothetical protein
MKHCEAFGFCCDCVAWGLFVLVNCRPDDRLAAIGTGPQHGPCSRRGNPDIAQLAAA